MKYNKSPRQNKFHYINEIINIMKKHNLSISDIIQEYLYKYKFHFNAEDKIKNKNIYNNLIIYNNIINISEKNIAANNNSWINDFTIIDNYDEFLLL